jgi:predicted TIM-barrel fold metal-dependent hydrolase
MTLDDDIRVFDAHLHIIDPRFPLVANQGYLPEPFTVADYRRRTAALPIAGGAVVSGSFQAFDQSYLLDALARLGPGFVGVTQLPASASDELILELDRAGVRAVRFNLRRGGSAGLDDLETLARRVHALAGWHVELYLDGRDLPALERRLLALPRLSIDHLGLHRDGLPSLLRLVERGAKVKASGFGRVDLDPRTTLRAIADVDPRALLFGTDLPSTRARRPFSHTDLALVLDALGPELAARALHDNALAWYRPGQA